MKRPLSDYLTMIAVMLNAGLLCIITYQATVLAELHDLLIYLRDHCVFTP